MKGGQKRVPALVIQKMCIEDAGNTIKLSARLTVLTVQVLAAGEFM